MDIPVVYEFPDDLEHIDLIIPRLYGLSHPPVQGSLCHLGRSYLVRPAAVYGGG